MNKIVIIGCGNVGMSYAYALINQKCNIDELVLIDQNIDKANGEAMDLNHSIPYSPNNIIVKSGDYSECADATIVMIAAGANQNVGETRLDLIHKNTEIFKSIIDKVMATGFNSIFLIATNPVDAMSYITYKYSHLPASQIIGTGTSLDTARLRYILSRRFEILPQNVHAYVLGEHGDSEFVAWSSAMIGSVKIDSLLSQKEKNNISKEVRESAYEIIKKKGNTSYGIGMCLLRITNAILNDENAIITVSAFDKDVYISSPCIINKNGIKRRLKIELTEEEQNLYNKSKDIIHNSLSN